MKVLLIEDDPIIGPNIAEYLEENNFIVTLKNNGEDGLKEVFRNKYDIFLFDVMLPHKSGFEIAKEARENKIETPILFLTAKEDLESIEKGFNIGGDDYLTKPFKLKELLLRIRAILKRTQKTTTINTIKIGDIELNLNLKEVHRAGKKIELTPKEFQILEYLMKNKNKVIPKKELLEYIWGINNDIWSDVIRSHIQIIRSKLNKGFTYDPIKTIRGIGFKFEDNEIINN